MQHLQGQLQEAQEKISAQATQIERLNSALAKLRPARAELAASQQRLEELEQRHTQETEQLKQEHKLHEDLLLSQWKNRVSKLEAQISNAGLPKTVFSPTVAAFSGGSAESKAVPMIGDEKAPTPLNPPSLPSATPVAEVQHSNVFAGKAASDEASGAKPVLFSSVPSSKAQSPEKAANVSAESAPFPRFFFDLAGLESEREPFRSEDEGEDYDESQEEDGNPNDPEILDFSFDLDGISESPAEEESEAPNPETPSPNIPTQHPSTTSIPADPQQQQPAPKSRVIDLSQSSQQRRRLPINQELGSQPSLAVSTLGKRSSSRKSNNTGGSGSGSKARRRKP